MYSPGLGRFLSQDPLPIVGPDILTDNNWFGERLTAMRNQYGYCSNSPVDKVDPSGLVQSALRSRSTIPIGIKRCPSGWTILPRPGYVTPPPNGCGAQGSFLGFPPDLDFTECCNAHDNCYGACHSSKESIGKAGCDTRFWECMHQVCDAIRFGRGPFPPPGNADKGVRCDAWAYVFWKAVDKYGGPAWQVSQENACICAPPCEPPLGPNWAEGLA